MDRAVRNGLSSAGSAALYPWIARHVGLEKRSLLKPVISFLRGGVSCHCRTSESEELVPEDIGGGIAVHHAHDRAEQRDRLAVQIAAADKGLDGRADSGSQLGSFDRVVGHVLGFGLAVAQAQAQQTAHTAVAPAHAGHILVTRAGQSVDAALLPAHVAHHVADLRQPLSEDGRSNVVHDGATAATPSFSSKAPTSPTARS